MANNERKIAEIKELVQEGLKILNRSEGKVESLKQQKQAIENEIRELGIEPNELEQKMEALKNEIILEKEALERDIPFDLIHQLKNNDVQSNNQ